jgi:hypothetical protein
VVEIVRTIEQSTDFEEKRIVKQDESDGGSKFTTTIGFKAKSLKS